MNANSLNDEPKTEPDTLQGMSEGAKMLIERMKTHPEEFSRTGRFHHIFEGTGPLSLRDEQALLKARDLLVIEPTFTEIVYGMIFNKDEYNYKYVKAQGQFIKGWTDPRTLYGQREDLRVSASENGVNQIQTLSHNQTILQKIKSIIT